MAKFIEITTKRSIGKAEKVLINVDQIVSVEQFDRMCRIITTAVHPMAHGTGTVSYDTNDKDVLEKIMGE